MMTDKMYDFLKWLAQLFLPALATLWVAVASIWGLPFCEEIGGTIMAADTFLGVILKLSSDKYYREFE